MLTGGRGTRFRSDNKRQRQELQRYVSRKLIHTIDVNRSPKLGIFIAFGVGDSVLDGLLLEMGLYFSTGLSTHRKKY